MTDEAAASIRVDKWLWHARFFKTRGLASRLVSDGNLRINGERSTKPARAVRPGDVLTFVAGRRTRVIRIAAIGTRRGPAPEAQALYEDLSPPETPPEPRVGARPTKKDRRALDRSRDTEA